MALLPAHYRRRTLVSVPEPPGICRMGEAMTTDTVGRLDFRSQGQDEKNTMVSYRYGSDRIRNTRCNSTQQVS